MSNSPRLNPPELLTGVPDLPLIEIAAGRPWLSVAETNRLIKQQGLSLAVAQAWVLDELVAEILLTPEEEKSLIRKYMEAQGVGSDEELARWLKQKRLDFKDLHYFATKAERIKKWQYERFAEEVEIRFLERKLELDRVVYSLLRVKDQETAYELYFRIKQGEENFSGLAEKYSLGQEQKTFGLIGPVSLAAGHPELAAKLRISSNGQLWPPFPVGDVWVVLRFEKLLPAQLNEEMRKQMLEELFQVWFRERVQLLMDGDPLPPLPFLPGESNDTK